MPAWWSTESWPLPVHGIGQACRPVAAVLLVLAFGAAGLLQGWHRDPRAAAAADDIALPADVAALPRDKYGELVRQGYAIFTDTPRFAARYSGNALSCTHCHLDAGRRPNAAPMSAAWGMYPAFSAKADRVITLGERIQQCFRFSIDGVPPPLDSHEVLALSTYMQWLARGQPVGVAPPGRGFPTVARTGVDPDPLRGKALYAARCAGCHGARGEGTFSADGKTVVPPLWGLNSFNKGAGMHRADLLAGFVKANMPLDNPNLGDQEALDLAAWIVMQERGPDPRKGVLAWFLDR